MMAARIIIRDIDPKILAAERRLWKALRIHEGPLTIRQLHDLADVDLGIALAALRRWADEGEIIDTGRRTGYRICEENRHRVWMPRRKNVTRRFQPGTVRHRMWLVMRVMGRFDLASLTMATGHVSRLRVREYCNLLERAGYLHRCEGEPHNPRWRLQLGHGPKNPTITQRKEKGRRILRVTDFNKDIIADIFLDEEVNHER